MIGLHDVAASLGGLMAGVREGKATRASWLCGCGGSDGNLACLRACVLACAL